MKRHAPAAPLVVAAVLAAGAALGLAACRRDAAPPAPAATVPSLPDPGSVPDVLQINEPGQDVDVMTHLVPGQHVVVDFYSPFCRPCMRLAPRLEALAQQNPKVVLRKIDINRPGVNGIDWASPVARNHRLQSIPHLVIYAPDGSLEAEGNRALQRIAALEAER